MTHIDDKKFTNKVKRGLDQQVSSLDAQTQQRLRAAREIALSQKTNKASVFDHLNLKWLTGAGAGLALASLMTFMLVPGLMSEKSGFSETAFLEDIELLSQETEFDLYTQLDFYEWLDDSLEVEL